MICQEMKLGTSVIPHFHVLLTSNPFRKNIFYHSSSSSRSKGQFQGQGRENISFNK